MRLELGEVWNGGLGSRERKKRVVPAVAHIKGPISCLSWVPSLLTVHVLQRFNLPGLRVLRSCKPVLGRTGSSESTADKRRVIVFTLLVISRPRAIINPTDFAICFQQSHYKVTTTSQSPGSHAAGDLLPNITVEWIFKLHITWLTSPLPKFICV